MVEGWTDSVSEDRHQSMDVMAEALTHSTSKTTDEDISAIAIYLKDRGKAVPKGDQVAVPDNTMRTGAAIYKDSCAACHKDTGEGEARLFPRLAGSALMQSNDPITLVRVVLDGTRAASTDGMPTAPAMPAFAWRVDDAQVAAVLTYIRNSWDNAAPPVAASTIAKQRASLVAAP
jgi:mono/diheme cytochrome c family protein